MDVYNRHRFETVGSTTEPAQIRKANLDAAPRAAARPKRLAGRACPSVRATAQLLRPSTGRCESEARELAMLSPYERRRLREIEEMLETNDPYLVDYVRTAEQSAAHRHGRIATCAAAAGVLIFLLGLVLAVPSAIFLGLLLGLGGCSLRSWLRWKEGKAVR